MKLFIPTVGTVLRLTENWQLYLYAEYRNAALFSIFVNPEINRNNFYRYYPYNCNSAVPILLPKGSVLTIDRIYIRKNLKSFDSVSFRLKCEDLKIKNKRFWAKLDDVNKIECEVIDDI